MSGNNFSITSVLIYLTLSIVIIIISFVILISDQLLFLFLILVYFIYIIIFFASRVSKGAILSFQGGPVLHGLREAEKGYIFKNVIIPIYEPPSLIHPAFAGFLIDKNVGRREFLATLFNAIISGYVVIDERCEKDDYKYYFIKNLPVMSTSVCERIVCDYIFDSGDKNLDSIAMESVKINADILSKYVFDESIKLKYFENPYCASKEYLKLKNDPIGFEREWIESIDKARFWARIFSLGTEKEMQEKEAERAKVKVREFMNNINKRSLGDPNDKLMYNGLFYSEIGACERSKWLGFKDYLQTAERFRLDTERVEEFSFYLPYAVALGVEIEWINRFKDVDVDRVEWFRSQKDESIRRHDNHPLKYEHLVRFMGRIHTIN